MKPQGLMGRGPRNAPRLLERKEVGEVSQGSQMDEEREDRYRAQ
jgi:hypothetical protein